MFGCGGHDLALGCRCRTLNNKPVSGLHADQNPIGAFKIDGDLGVRNAAGYDANFPRSQTKILGGALEIGASSCLDKQFRRRMKKKAASSLKKPLLLGNMGFQTASPQRGEHFFDVRRNRKHKVRFLSLIADKCHPWQLIWRKT
jgi:hypothetical protein